MTEPIEVRPNVGFQEAFLASSADFMRIKTMNLSPTMERRLLSQARGTLAGLVPCSCRHSRTRRALTSRGLLDLYQPTLAGWAKAAELLEALGHERTAEHCSMLATGHFRLRKRTNSPPWSRLSAKEID